MARKRGFSLTELMIAVAIMGILTCIAYPMYTGYLEGSKRTEASSNLEELRLLEEEYFALNGDYGPPGLYNGAAAIQGLLPDWLPPNNGANMNYTYYIQTAAGPPPTFTAGAVPNANAPADPAVGGAPVANTVCSIDQNNTRQGASFW